MTTNKHCSRDDCPPANVKPDQTKKCFNCNRCVHLPCIGISLKTSQISSPNIRIFCNTCTNETSNGTQSNDLNASFSAKSTPNKMSIRLIMNEVKSLRAVIEENSKKLDTIDEKTTGIDNSTKMIASKVLRPALMHPNENTSITSKSPNTSKSQVNTPKSQLSRNSFANIIRNNPINSAKRPRTDISPKTLPQNIKSRNFDAPVPKSGTKSATHRLKVVAAPKRAEKPIFKKAIWVSGFKPITTTEEISDYIMSETPVNEKSRFNVHKLVKKDKDVTTLKFVSFKIELNDKDFDTLINPEVWEEDVLVREFLQNTTLGDYLESAYPSLNSKNIRKSPTPDSMDVTESTLSKVTESSSDQATSSNRTKRTPTNEQTNKH